MSNPKKSSSKNNKGSKHNNNANVDKSENEAECKFNSPESRYSSRTNSHVEVRRSVRKPKTDSRSSSVPSRPSTRRNYNVMPNNYLKISPRPKINDLSKKIPLIAEPAALYLPNKSENHVVKNVDNKKANKSKNSNENRILSNENIKSGACSSKNSTPSNNSPVRSKILKNNKNYVISKKEDKAHVPRLAGAGSLSQAKSGPQKEPIVQDYEYLQFSLRITEDIIRNDLYSPKQMRRVFNSHIEANRGRLSLNKMLLQIDHLCRELDIAKKSTKNDRHDKKCLKCCSCNTKMSFDSDVDISSKSTKELVKKIFDGHVMTDQEIHNLSENELQDLMSEILNDHAESTEDLKTEGSKEDVNFDLILSNADHFGSVSDERFKNISSQPSNDSVGVSKSPKKISDISPLGPKTPNNSLESFDKILQAVILNLTKVVEENRSIFEELSKSNEALEPEKEKENNETKNEMDESDKACSLDCVSTTTKTSSNEKSNQLVSSDEQFRETELVKIELNSLEKVDYIKGDEDIFSLKESEIVEITPTISDNESKKCEKVEEDTVKEIKILPVENQTNFEEMEILRNTTEDKVLQTEDKSTLKVLEEIILKTRDNESKKSEKIEEDTVQEIKILPVENQTNFEEIEVLRNTTEEKVLHTEDKSTLKVLKDDIKTNVLIVKDLKIEKNCEERCKSKNENNQEKPSDGKFEEIVKDEQKSDLTIESKKETNSEDEIMKSSNNEEPIVEQIEKLSGDVEINTTATANKAVAPDLSLVEISDTDDKTDIIQLLLEPSKKQDENTETESSDTLNKSKANVEDETFCEDLVDEILVTTENSLQEEEIIEDNSENANNEKKQIISSITKFILDKTFNTVGNNEVSPKHLNTEKELQRKNIKENDFVSTLEKVLYNNYKELYGNSKVKCSESKDCKSYLPKSVQQLDKYKTEHTKIINKENKPSDESISSGEISRDSSDQSICKKICHRVLKKSQPSILEHLKKYERKSEISTINAGTQFDKHLLPGYGNYKSKFSRTRMYPTVGTQTSYTSYNVNDSFRDNLLSDGEVQTTSSDSSGRSEISDYNSFKRKL